MSDEPIDADDLDRLVREHLLAAMLFATRLTGDSSTAEEVVQESLYRAARSWRTYRRESSFRTWLFQIIINTYRDVRPVRKSLPDSRSLTSPQSGDPSQQLMQDELCLEVAACISRLPERQREVLVLTTFEELSTTEVARMLNITEQNVHATLHIARKRLREQLAGYLLEKE